MKLDYNCIRDLLLFLEGNIQYQTFPYGESSLIAPNKVDLFNVENALSQHSLEDITYCSIKLIEADFIDAHVKEADQGILNIYYYAISFAGHQYLDSVRSPKIWDRIISTFSDNAVPMTFGLIQGVSQDIIGKLLSL